MDQTDALARSDSARARDFRVAQAIATAAGNASSKRGRPASAALPIRTARPSASCPFLMPRHTKKPFG